MPLGISNTEPLDESDNLSVEWDKTEQLFKLWDVATGKLLRTFEGHSAGATQVAFSSDGHTVLSHNGHKSLEWFDVATGKLLRTFEAHYTSTTSVTPSPDARMVIESGQVGPLKLFLLSTGNEVLQLHANREGDWVP